MRETRRSSLPVLAAAALAVFVAIVLVEHVLVPGLAPRRNMLSEYANASGVPGTLMTVAFAAWALSFALTALVLIRAGGAAGTVLGAFLLVACAGMVLTAVAHTQTVAGVLPPGEARSFAGQVHDLASGAVLLCFFPAAVAGLVRFPRLRWFAVTTVIALTIAVAIVPLFGVLDIDADGLRQRVQVAAGCAWQLALLVAARQSGL